MPNIKTPIAPIIIIGLGWAFDCSTNAKIPKAATTKIEITCFIVIFLRIQMYSFWGNQKTLFHDFD